MGKPSVLNGFSQESSLFKTKHFEIQNYIYIYILLSHPLSYIFPTEVDTCMRNEHLQVLVFLKKIRNDGKSTNRSLKVTHSEFFFWLLLLFLVNSCFFSCASDNSQHGCYHLDSSVLSFSLLLNYFHGNIYLRCITWISNADLLIPRP